MNQNHFRSFNFAALKAIQIGQVDIVDNVIDHVEGVPSVEEDVENGKRLCFANNTVPCSQYQSLHRAIDSNANNACKWSKNRCKHSLSNLSNDDFEHLQSTGDAARCKVLPPLLWLNKIPSSILLLKLLSTPFEPNSFSLGSFPHDNFAINHSERCLQIGIKFASWHGTFIN
ncbi:putative [LysW]-L-2-aminoadipate/[LysW]-L-glutamate phosphate reductase [Trichinella pseudospiralis]